MPGMRQQLGQIAHFAIGAKRPRRHDRLNALLGKLRRERAEHGHGRVVERVDGEKKFDRRGIHLGAVAAQRLGESRVESLDRLQNGDGRRRRMLAG